MLDAPDVGDGEIVLCLKRQPELGRVAEKAGEAQRGVGRDTTTSLDDIRQAAVRDREGAGEGVLRKTVVGQPVLFEHLAWVHGHSAALGGWGGLHSKNRMMI